jgi:hypothetical protein
VDCESAIKSRLEREKSRKGHEGVDSGASGKANRRRKNQCRGGTGVTKNEVVKLLVLIESVYSHCMTKNETVMHWFNFCSEMDYNKVLVKLKDHIRKSPYPPTIANLALFNHENNEFPARLERWIEGERERIEQDRQSGKHNQIPEWMLEYTTRKSVRS